LTVLTNNFLNLFRTLDSKACAAFQRHLLSRHSVDDQVFLLFQYVRKHTAQPDRPQMWVAEQVHKKVFPEATFSKDRLSNLYSDLYLALKDFLLGIETSKDDWESQQLWLNILLQRGLVHEARLLHTWMKKDNKAIAKPSLETLQRAKHLYAQEVQSFAHISDADLEEKIRNYMSIKDLTYAVETLKTACEAIGFNSLKGFDLQVPTAQIMSSLQLDAAVQHPVLRLYAAAYRLLEYPDENTFVSAKNVFLASAPCVGAVEMHKVFSYLLNYAAAQVQNGKDQYWQEAFDLIQFSFAEGVFATKGAMPLTQFNNIVHIATVCKALDWADQFLNVQQHLLTEVGTEACISIAKATLLFEQGHYAEALQLLVRTNTVDEVQFNRLNVLIIKCYYLDAPDSKPLADRIESFRQYVYRKRRAHKHPSFEGLLNFLKVVRHLSERTLPPAKIRAAFHNGQPLANRPWLEKMLEAYRPH
jgi:hypothetical protein